MKANSPQGKFQLFIVCHINKSGWWFEPVIIDGELIEFILINDNQTFQGFSTVGEVLKYIRGDSCD